MFEIRLARSDAVTGATGQPRGPGRWVMDTFKHRLQLQTLVARECAAHGDGTHWIEQRTRDTESEARFQHSNFGLSDFGKI